MRRDVRERGLSSLLFVVDVRLLLLRLTGGSYSLFAGRDATRALSKMQLDPSLFAHEYDDLTDLTDNERATARNWHEDFRGKSIRHARSIGKRASFPR